MPAKPRATPSTAPGAAGAGGAAGAAACPPPPSPPLVDAAAGAAVAPPLPALPLLPLLLVALTGARSGANVASCCWWLYSRLRLSQRPSSAALMVMTPLEWSMSIHTCAQAQQARTQAKHTCKAEDKYYA